MYNFIDVTEASEGVVLPSEAMKINGEYIEDLIVGYRTLNVSGREALSPDVTEFEVGVRDGTTLEKKRYPSRVIVITYQLTAKSNAEFREAYNQLGKILDVKDAQLIFNDEQDKYFTGTPCIIDTVEPGLNSVVGKFEILCTDPFKYSVNEFEVMPLEDDNSFVFDYGGTYRAFPKLEASFYDETEIGADGETAKALTGSGDCGYVAFFNEAEKIIQLGDPGEADGETAYAKSQTLMNQTFLDSTSWGTTAKSLWAVNSGIILPADVQQMGTVGMGYAKDATSSYSGKTSGHLFKCGYNGLHFSAGYSTKNRTANSVEVCVAATVQTNRMMAANEIATVRVTIGGVSKTMTVKQYGKVATPGCYSGGATFKITGLTLSQKTITGCAASVATANGSATAPSCNSVNISPFTAGTAAEYYITASDFGTASGKWHGPSITRTIGADASGEVGAANFTLTYEQKMCIGEKSNSINELGGFHVHLSDANGKVVAGVRIVKNQTGSRAASLMIFVNGVKVHQVGIDLAYNSKFFGANPESVNTSTIRKSGNKLEFTLGGYSQTFTEDAIKDVKVTKVTFVFEQYSTATKLSYNGLFWAKFVKDNCNTWRDIPNKFSANDVVVADCKNAEIYLNGVKTPNLGALGNNWEEFYLTPGMNQIGFSYSDWVDAEHAPTCRIRYREVFL